MYSLEILALLGTHDTGRRQTNTKAQHNITQHRKLNRWATWASSKVRCSRRENSSWMV